MIDQSVSAEMLANIPLLHNLNETERRQMADIASLRHFAPGEVVVRQGEDSQTLWVVLEGKCEVVKHLEHGPHNSLVLAILEPFSHFGEMSFFSPAPHSASVRAQTAVTVLAHRPPRLRRSDSPRNLGRLQAGLQHGAQPGRPAAADGRMGGRTGRPQSARRAQFRSGARFATSCSTTGTSSGTSLCGGAGTQLCRRPPR